MKTVLVGRTVDVSPRNKKLNKIALVDAKYKKNLNTYQNELKSFHSYSLKENDYSDKVMDFN